MGQEAQRRRGHIGGEANEVGGTEKEAEPHRRRPPEVKPDLLKAPQSASLIRMKKAPPPMLYPW